MALQIRATFEYRTTLQICQALKVLSHLSFVIVSLPEQESIPSALNFTQLSVKLSKQ